MTYPRIWQPYFYAALLCALVVLVSSALLPRLDLGGIGLLFLLTVALVAVRHGAWPAVFAAVLAGLLLNFFFVFPPLGFALGDTRYLATFAAMLLVGGVVGHLTAGRRYEAEAAARREQRAQELSDFAREMSGAVEVGQVVDRAQRLLGSLLDGQVVLLLPDAQGELVAPAPVAGLDAATVQLAFSRDMPRGLGTAHAPDSPFHYIPLHAPSGVCGVLALRPRRRGALRVSGLSQEIDAFARLVAIAVERIHFVDVAQEMRLRAASENLRNSMLAALSHDLRTPLSSMIGLVDALVLDGPPLSSSRNAIVADMRESTQHMARLVNNLLDMARIQSGDIRLRREWQAIEETIGSALRLLRVLPGDHRVRVGISPDLPLVEFDALLIERVIANLVENAIRHSPADSEIRIDVAHDGDTLVIVVADSGAGLPPGLDPFGRFVRGEDATGPGVGLGLAISRAFVEAHGGSIAAGNREGGGAVFTVRLPAGRPPDIGPGSGPMVTER